MIKFTIATVTYNPGNLLQHTIESVEEQDWPNVQHLIVDGNSQDDTLTLVHHYQERNSIANVPHEITCISEPDHGLYDAMNKAIHLAKGSYILFLNAGDCLHSSHLLTDLAQQIKQYEELPAVIYGFTDIVDDNYQFVKPRRLVPPEKLSWKSFQKGMLVCHQAFFARTDLAQQNLYNLKYRISSDFDWCVRIMKVGQQKHLPLHHSHLVVADFLEGGLSIKNHKASLRERFHIMVRHYGFFSTVARHGGFVLRSLYHTEPLRFVMVGGAATLLQYILYLASLFVMSASAALAVSYILSFVANFVLTSCFTFKKKATVSRGIGFGMAHLINFALQLGLLNLFLAIGIPKAWALLPVFAICIPVNFLLVRKAFRH